MSMLQKTVHRYAAYLLVCSVMLTARADEAVTKATSTAANAQHSDDNNTRNNVVDEVLATVYTDNGKELVLMSDLRPALDGTPRDLREAVLDTLKIAEAKRFGIQVSEDDIDQFLAKIERDNNLTHEQVEQIFAELGYTFDEGRQVLRNQQIVERITEQRVKQDRRLLVQRDDIIAYDEQHPAYESAEYTLEIAFIPSQQYSHDDVDQYIASGKIDTIAEWQEQFTISEDDLNPEMAHIDHEKPGTIVDVEKSNAGTEVTRLAGKQERQRIPVDKRYDEIAQKIRTTGYNEVMKEYNDRLLRDAKVRFTYDEDRGYVYNNQSQ